MSSTRHLKNGLPSFSRIHLSVCAALAMPLAVSAQESGVSQLAPVKVQGNAPEFKPEAVQTPKFQAPLLDTPQSISIVPSEVLKQQNAQSLQDVLDNVPGITFSSGEGGAGWGDMFTIRGFSAEQSITVDGVRDSALSSRNDTFNLEQVEVFKGTGSIESGVGAVGGSVNLVTKTPKLDDFYDVGLTVGTDQYRRATIDLNTMVGKTSAFRLNAMKHHNDVAGRGATDFDRWGVAPSFSWGLGTSTRITAAYMYQKDKNTPDWGVPLGRDGQRMNGIGRDYWGQLENADIEETESNSALLRLEHDFSSKASIRNQTRWSETKRFTYLTTGGRLLNARLRNGKTAPGVGEFPGTYNNSDYWGYDAKGNESYPTGYLAAPRLQGNMNSYKGRILANQTDLNLDFNTGSIRHQLTTGIEYYEESYRKDPFSRSVPDISGRRIIDVRNPDTHYSGPWRTENYTNESGAEVKNIGVYAYDHITLTQQWEIAAGLRYDRYTVNWYDVEGNKEPYKQREGIWSGRLGVIYKPIDNGSIYLSYSQASQPSAAAAASRSGGGGNTNVADYSPGKASTWELGTKWDLLDDQLSLTAAVFQVERSNPSDADPNNPTESIQKSAKERVRGIELGLAGQLTAKWSAYGGVSFLDSKILENQDDPSQVGGKMKNVPDITFNVWTNYQFDPQWDAGVGAQYIGKRRFTEGNTVSFQNVQYSADANMPSYWLFNASVGYAVNKNLALRVNVNNIFDTFYIQQGSSSSDGFQLFGMPGAGRTVMLSAEASF